MTAPTAAEIRAWSKINFDPLGYESDPELQVLVTRAAALVSRITGQTWESMPTDLEPLAAQAVQLLTEQIALQSTEDIAETAADFHLISSFSAGSYSETRRSLSEFAAKTKMLNPNPIINDLLFLLMTEAERESWEEFITGNIRPEFDVTEVDWEFYSGRYDLFPGE